MVGSIEDCRSGQALTWRPGRPRGRYGADRDSTVAGGRAPTYAQRSPGARRAHSMRCQPTAPQSPCSGPAGVARGVWPPKKSPEDRRGGLRGSKVVSGYPRESPPAAPSRMFGFTRRAPTSPDFAVGFSPFCRPTRSLRLLICSPLHNQPPYVILGLVATSILILIVARFSP